MTAEEWIQNNLKDKIRNDAVIIRERPLEPRGGTETISIRISNLAAQFRKLLEDNGISDENKIKYLDEFCFYPKGIAPEVKDASVEIAQIKGITISGI